MAKDVTRRRKGGNSQNTDFGAYVSFSGVDHVTGELTKHSEDGVHFQYFRYGSLYKQFFPAERIIACVGALGSKESMLWFKTDKKTLWDTGKRDRPLPINDPKPYGSHLMRTSSPDFSIILLSPMVTTIIGKTTDGTSGRGRKKKGVSGEKKEGKKKKSDGEKGKDWA
jgi:hypothetical protein